MCKWFILKGDPKERRRNRKEGESIPGCITELATTVAGEVLPSEKP